MDGVLVPLRLSLPGRRVAALFAPLLLAGCGATFIYQDNFNAGALGAPPAPPATGTSDVQGDVLVAADPTGAGSADRWLRLDRTRRGAFSEYTGVFEQTLTGEGNVALVGFVASQPAFPTTGPPVLSVYLETPDVPPAIRDLLHIDLLPDGGIRVNDGSPQGSYAVDTLIGMLIRLDLQASPPTATLLIRGGDRDLSTTVEIDAAVARIGLGRLRVLNMNPSDNERPGLFLVNDVTATRAD